jgi:transposase
VVATTIRTFQASGLEYARIDTMADSLLMQALAGERVQEKSARYQELSQRFPAMVVELKKKGVTLQWLWELYIQEYPGGYQYSQYCLNFHRWRKSPDVVMHIEHKAGEEIFVDWAGDNLEVSPLGRPQPSRPRGFPGIRATGGCRETRTGRGPACSRR